MASTARKIPPPAPPHRSGTSMPMRPSSKNLGMRLGSNRAASSMLETRGRTSDSANSRTESRNRPSSSERVVSAAGASVRRSCIGWGSGSGSAGSGAVIISPGRKRYNPRRLGHLKRPRASPQRRGGLAPLDPLRHRRKHLPRDLHALGQSRVLPHGARSPHALQNLRGHRDARDLVGEEFGIAERDQRPDAGHDRNPELLD